MIAHLGLALPRKIRWLLAVLLCTLGAVAALQMLTATGAPLAFAAPHSQTAAAQSAGSAPAAVTSAAAEKLPSSVAENSLKPSDPKLSNHHTGARAIETAPAGVLPETPQSTSGAKVVLPVGHIDSPKVFWGKNGFELKANVGKLYNLEETISWLRPNVYDDGNQYYGFAVGNDSPALDFLGKGTTWWAGPSNCTWCGQIWQGFGADTAIPYEQFRDGAGVPAANAEGTFWLNLVSITGPGRLEMLGGNKVEGENWGTFRRLISSDETSLRSAALKPGTHTHIWTLFSAPGDYQLVWQVSARKNDGSIITSRPTVQQWRVGGSEPPAIAPAPLAKRFAQAPQGNTDGYRFSVRSTSDEAAEQTGMNLARWEFSAPESVNGTAEIYINGYLMTSMNVQGGKGSFTQLPAATAAQYQLVFIPNSETSAQPQSSPSNDGARPSSAAGRWVSAPVTYTPGGDAVSTSTPSTTLPAPLSSLSSPTLDLSQTTVLRDLKATVNLGPGKFDTTFSVDVRLSDPHARGDVILDFFEPGSTSQYPDSTYAGTLVNGHWADQIEDLEYTSGLEMRLTYLPHSNMENVHKKTATVVAKFDPTVKSSVTVPLSSSDSTPSDPKPGTEPKPGTDPTPTPDPAPRPQPEPQPQPDPAPSPQPQPEPNPGGDTPGSESPSHPKDTNPPFSKRFLLDEGHVDLAAQLVDGELDLRVKDDTGLIDKGTTMRLPHTVAFGVRDHAREKITEKRVQQGFGFLGAVGTSTYVIPEKEKPGLIWPGYSTEMLAGAVDLASQRLNISLLKGPGDVKLYQTNLGKPTVLFDSAKAEDAAITVPGPVHVHTAWAFTKPGRYEVLLFFTANAPDGTELPPVERSVTFLVGDETITAATDLVVAHPTDDPKPDPAPGTDPAPRPQPEPQPQPDPAPSPQPQPEPNPGKTPAPGPDVTPTPNPGGEQPGKRLTLDHGHTDIFNVSIQNGALHLELKEDVTGHHVAHAPENVQLVVKPKAFRELPAGYPAAPRAYVLPLNQDQELLWPGWSTLETQKHNLHAVDLVIDQVKGPGAVHVFSQDFLGTPTPLLAKGATALPGTITVPEPAHVHAYWAFTKPGTYTMRVTAKAKLGGKLLVSAPHTYTWIVQPAGAEPGPAGPGTTPAPQPKPNPQPAPKPMPQPHPGK